MKARREWCPDCEGRGEWWGIKTNDPAERSRWHVCWNCAGTGMVRNNEIEQQKVHNG